jgi:hypothetical protein
MKFALSPVEPSDMDEIIRLQFLCFGGTDMHVVFFGHCEPAKVEAKKRHLHDLATDPCNMWLKIVNMDTDKMVSASNWCISPTRVEKDEPIKVDWLEDPEEIKSAEEVLEDYMGRRKKHMTQPHVLLNILFTDPAYQGQGAGTIYCRWGADLADRMMVEMWLEATKYGYRLYKSCGFEDVEEVVKKTGRFTRSYTLMKRPKKVGKMLMEGRR